MNNSNVVAIVSHDAGGAEILASYVAQNKLEYQLVIEGPAVNVFKRRLGVVEIHALEDAITACDWCLCGTGWQSELEWRAIEQARKAGKHVVAFLDHWINYKERFIRNCIPHLPDEIWVGDTDAKELAHDLFPSMLIRLVPNPYFIDIKNQIAESGDVIKKNEEQEKRILFVCENISDHSRLKYGDERYWGYTEVDAIKFFFKQLNTIASFPCTVVIRPHPTDVPGKYDWVFEAYPSIAKLSDGRPLIQDVAAADVVVGCESVAMAVGLLAQKKVISCIPPGGHSCRLPQRDIVHLSKVTELSPSE